MSMDCTAMMFDALRLEHLSGHTPLADVDRSTRFLSFLAWSADHDEPTEPLSMPDIDFRFSRADDVWNSWPVFHEACLDLYTRLLRPGSASFLPELLPLVSFTPAEFVRFPTNRLRNWFDARQALIDDNRLRDDQSFLSGVLLQDCSLPPMETYPTSAPGTVQAFIAQYDSQRPPQLSRDQITQMTAPASYQAPQWNGLGNPGYLRTRWAPVTAWTLDPSRTKGVYVTTPETASQEIALSLIRPGERPEMTTTPPANVRSSPGPARVRRQPPESPTVNAALHDWTPTWMTTPQTPALDDCLAETPPATPSTPATSTAKASTDIGPPATMGPRTDAAVGPPPPATSSGSSGVQQLPPAPAPVPYKAFPVAKPADRAPPPPPPVKHSPPPVKQPPVKQPPAPVAPVATIAPATPEPSNWRQQLLGTGPPPTITAETPAQQPHLPAPPAAPSVTPPGSPPAPSPPPPPPPPKMPPKPPPTPAAIPAPWSADATPPTATPCPPGPVTRWRTFDVGLYLDYLELSHLREQFRLSGVDGPLLLDCSTEELERIFSLNSMQARKIKQRLPLDLAPPAAPV
jgi:hypothetical protein